ncbi:glycosyltransferase family 2 protein [Desulfosarcina widdelii]|uniref:glycosyltransferase family 2 protein n=1 Tax=Desulfosarcina widdelii TaxID=947919 RepID=UPI0012D2A6B4|nr:glycosyltransferase [Desulfosarcina widdelii]
MVTRCGAVVPKNRKDYDGILVSVCVQTYQHAQYIRQAVDSILMQNTDFEFEILLGEDGSTDGTREICLEYAEKYPGKIRVFQNSREDVIYVNGRPTGRSNFLNNVRNSRGKYIALLPGDDYWTDHDKLQKQVDILERDDNVVACHHWHEHRYENGIRNVGTPKKGHGYYPRKVASVKEIFENRLRLKSRTLMFRNLVDDRFFPDWFNKIAFGDVALSFILGQFGDFYFIDEPMAAYRLTGKGVSTAGWTPDDSEMWMREHNLSYVEIWNHANRLHAYRYNRQTINSIVYFLKDIMQKSEKPVYAFFYIIFFLLNNRNDRIRNRWAMSVQLSKYAMICLWSGGIQR